MFENFFKKLKTNVSVIKDKLVFLSELKNFSTIFNIFFSLFIILTIADLNIYYYVSQSFLSYFLTYCNYYNNFYLVTILLSLLSAKNIICNHLFSSQPYQTKFNNQSNSLYLNFLYLTYIKEVLLINLNFLISYVFYFISNFVYSNFFFRFIYSKLYTFLTPIS